MNYFVYDREGEFIDVFEFNKEELAMYKMSNPLYTVELEKNIDKFFLIKEDYYNSESECGGLWGE